jgi:predicted nuclease of restriction endonuclease-like (RecB) superfamily
MKTKLPLSPEYVEFVTELKSRIKSARISAARAVNRDLILLYWDIGRGILERQAHLGWGKAVVATLAKDLTKEFPSTNSFSPDNLWRMRQLYAAYTDPGFLGQLVPETPSERGSAEILGQPVPELRAEEERAAQLVAAIPWGHNLLILKRITEPRARLYYLRAAAKLGWSRNVLLNQIKAKAYERSLAEGKTHNFPAVLPEYLAEQAEEALKSSYNLEFLGIRREVKERELEDRLIERLQQFILELGYGFCFIGRQHRLSLGKKEYFIDLLFYHRFLKALVAVELKVGPFEPEYAGKMDFYLNLLNDKERGHGDNPSIGIILCAEKDDIVVEFSLKTKTNPIGVAEYHLTGKLPRALKGKLPSERQLLVAVKEAIEDRP